MPFSDDANHEIVFVVSGIGDEVEQHLEEALGLVQHRRVAHALDDGLRELLLHLFLHVAGLRHHLFHLAEVGEIHGLR